MQPTSSRRSLLNYIGIVILILGLGLGEFIYWRSMRRDQDAENTVGVINTLNARGYERELGTNVGTFGLIVDQWEQTFSGLGESKAFAITIAVGSAIVAGVFFLRASRLPRE